MNNLELEFEIAKSIVEDWEAFLFSKDIYWALNLTNKSFSASEKRLRATAGRFLIAVFYLDKYPFSASKEILKKFYQLKDQWLSNWQIKVETELPARIHQWGELCKDLRRDSNFSNAQLKSHIYIRLMLDLLLNELNSGQKEDYRKQVRSFDRLYKLNSVESRFLWDDKLMDIFPEDQYWYLYREFNTLKGS